MFSAQFKGEQCIIKSEFIYQPQDVHFPSCHASTIIQNGKGLLAAWFGGTREKNPDVGIWVSRTGKEAGQNPSKLQTAFSIKGKDIHAGIRFFYNSGKEILLFYKVGPSPSNGGVS